MNEPFITREIAETLCVCLLTDGFCSPSNKEDCKCWKMARDIVSRLAKPHKSVLFAGWEVTHEAFLAKDKADPEKILQAMLNAKPKEQH